MSAVLYSDVLAAAQPSDAALNVRPIPKRWTAVLIVGDLVMFLLAARAATSFVQSHWNAGVDVQQVGISTVIYAAVWSAIFWRLGLYSRSLAFNVRDEFYYTAAALCIGALPQFVIFSIFPSISTSRAALGLSLLLSIPAVGIFRASVHKAYELATRSGLRVVVVGDPSRIDGVVEQLCCAGNFRVYWLAVRDLDDMLHKLPIPSAAHINAMAWWQHALRLRADRLIFTEAPPPDALPHLISAAAACGLQLAIAPPRIRAHAFNVAVDRVGAQVLIVPQCLRACRPGARLFKRLFDLALGSVLFVLFAPPMLFITGLLALDRSGPILFKQQRVGRNGMIFDMMKFRTMRVDAEANGAQFAVRGDPRVTKLGRILRSTSFDELPQIFNVIRGEMSIVGPRPERPIFVEQFRKRYPRYDDRALVKPGITGCSQVNMRRVMVPDEIDEKLKHDLFYIENWSPLLDVSVLTKTAIEFLFHRAA